MRTLWKWTVRLVGGPGALLPHGEYVARTACTECHGLDLGESAPGPAPGRTGS